MLFPPKAQIQHHIQAINVITKFLSKATSKSIQFTSYHRYGLLNPPLKNMKIPYANTSRPNITLKCTIFSQTLLYSQQLSAQDMDIPKKIYLFISSPL